LQAQEIKDKLNSLISDADLIDPSLAKRLDEINRWVKDVKPGSLTAKKFVMAFLLQLIRDSQVWLTVQSLSSGREQEAAFELMTPGERYWYSYLFPKWLNENDRKFYIWKQKLKSGKFDPADDLVIRAIAARIVDRQGTVLYRSCGEYINETIFLISPNAIETAQFQVLREKLRHLAVFSDGLQMLALKIPEGTPHGPFLRLCFGFLASGKKRKMRNSS